jgi:hypothetical protein
MDLVVTEKRFDACAQMLCAVVRDHDDGDQGAEPNSPLHYSAPPVWVGSGGSVEELMSRRRDMAGGPGRKSRGPAT